MPIQPSLKPETVKKGQFEFNIFFSMFIQMEDLEIYQVLNRFPHSFRVFFTYSGCPTHMPLLMSGSVFFIRPAVIELSRPSALVEIMLFSLCLFLPQ